MTNTYHHGSVFFSDDDIYGDDPDYGFMNVKITSQSPFYDLSSSSKREIKERIDLLR